MGIRHWSVTGRTGLLTRGRRTIVLILIVAVSLPGPASHSLPTPHTVIRTLVSTPPAPVNNFSASINRLVELVALAGSGILALVWARVALSWFSNDITKKIQAKDRARDALIGTLLFMAAVTGLLYGLAHWVLTGS